MDWVAWIHSRVVLQAGRSSMTYVKTEEWIGGPATVKQTIPQFFRATQPICQGLDHLQQHCMSLHVLSTVGDLRLSRFPPPCCVRHPSMTGYRLRVWWQDKTKESGEWERLRHEWFTMYLSSEAAIGAAEWLQWEFLEDQLASWITIFAGCQDIVRMWLIIRTVNSSQVSEESVR